MSKMSDSIIDVPVNDTDYDYIMREQEEKDIKARFELKYPSLDISDVKVADDGSGYSLIMNNKK